MTREEVVEEERAKTGNKPRGKTGSKPQGKSTLKLANTVCTFTTGEAEIVAALDDALSQARASPQGRRQAA